MKHDTLSSGKRETVSLSLDTGLVAAAREAGLDLSRICETALREATRIEAGERWKEEHREAIEANNAWVEKHGLPLAKYRMF
jgi:antitoxin CcdA